MKLVWLLVKGQWCLLFVLCSVFYMVASMESLTRFEFIWFLSSLSCFKMTTIQTCWLLQKIFNYILLNFDFTSIIAALLNCVSSVVMC